MWAEGTMVPFANGFPRIRLRNVFPAAPEIELRGRALRPRSCSRTRTGGAASAVVLMMLGTGTLGALPLVNVHGRAVTTAATPHPATPRPTTPPSTPAGAVVVLAPAGLDEWTVVVAT